ncbi:MAG: succinylglutamate desuccinylase/aspartoacylase family protein [Bacteroidota bacterium]
MTKAFTVVLYLISLPLLSQSSFQNSFQNNSRPSSENLRIPFKDDNDRQGHLPITIVKGKSEGPVFTIVAGVHGFEYPPIMAVQELLQEFDANKLTGNLIIIPIANTGGFYGREPFYNPQDHINLNNAFPGDAKGSITQRLAAYITSEIIPVTDVFLDIHGGDAPEDLLPFVCYYRNENRPEQTQLAKQLSETSGFEYVVSYAYAISDDEPAKYAFKQAVQDGKTGVSLEAGKLGNVQADAVALVKNGVYNMLRELKMYQHEATTAKNPIKLNDQAYIRSSQSGIFYSDLKAGDTVGESQKVGYTTDEFGTVLEEYKAPISGIILYNLATPPINKGDTVMCIGTKL